MQKSIILALGACSLIATSQAVTINVGVEGCCDAEVNQWPGGEPPSAAIDGVGQKYLNFGKFNTGVVVTPANTGTTAISMQLWAANDAIGRDPASYLLYGTNSAIAGPSFDSSLFTLISSGALALPDGRNDGGVNPLLSVNSQTINFANSGAYDTYMVLFPTVKNPVVDGENNSMQIAEIQLFDAAGPIFAPSDTILGVQSSIPEPTTGLLALLGASALLRRRRK